MEGGVDVERAFIDAGRLNKEGVRLLSACPGKIQMAACRFRPPGKPSQACDLKDREQPPLRGLSATHCPRSTWKPVSAVPATSRCWQIVRPRDRDPAETKLPDCPCAQYGGRKAAPKICIEPRPPSGSIPRPHRHAASAASPFRNLPKDCSFSSNPGEYRNPCAPGAEAWHRAAHARSVRHRGEV